MIAVVSYSEVSVLGHKERTDWEVERANCAIKSVLIVQSEVKDKECDKISQPTHLTNGLHKARFDEISCIFVSSADSASWVHDKTHVKVHVEEIVSTDGSSSDSVKVDALEVSKISYSDIHAVQPKIPNDVHKVSDTICIDEHLVCAKIDIIKVCKVIDEISDSTTQCANVHVASEFIEVTNVPTDIANQTPCKHKNSTVVKGGFISFLKLDDKFHFIFDFVFDFENFGGDSESLDETRVQ